MRALFLALGALLAIAAIAVILWPSPAHAVIPGSGETFRDPLADGSPCAFCPAMAVMPPGRLVMGWPTDLDNPQMENFLDELQVPVRIPRALAVGQFEVTFEEWDACLADGGCLGHRPADYGWGRGARPVIDVSFEHAKAYVGWLSSKTGKPYRLPSEAEHEYATRAGTQSAFWWGETITPHQANYDAAKAYAGGGETGSRSARQSPSTATAPIPGAFIMSTAMSGSGPRIEDCWNFENHTNPGNGSARLTGACEERVVRNGGWDSEPAYLRANHRNRQPVGARWNDLGFRVARDLGR